METRLSVRKIQSGIVSRRFLVSGPKRTNSSKGKIKIKNGAYNHCSKRGKRGSRNERFGKTRKKLKNTGTNNVPSPRVTANVALSQTGKSFARLPNKPIKAPNIIASSQACGSSDLSNKTIKPVKKNIHGVRMRAMD